MAYELINHTHWSTKDLRKFVNRCIKRVVISERDFVFEFRYRSGSSNCRDVCTGELIKISVPKEDVDKIDLAITISHSLGVSLGLSPASLKSPTFRKTGKYRKIYSWADKLDLRSEDSDQLGTLDRVLLLKKSLDKKQQKKDEILNDISKLKKQIAYHEQKLKESA